MGLIVLDRRGIPRFTGSGLAVLRLAAGVSRDWIASRTGISARDLLAIETSRGTPAPELASLILGALRCHDIAGGAPPLPQATLERILREAREAWDGEHSRLPP